MVTFEEAAAMLDEIADSLPPALAEGLTGGISLLPGEKVHPEAVADDYYVMGLYCRDVLGRYVLLYYGSFVKVLGNAPRDVWYGQLRKTLLHELTHHVEGQAFSRDLEHEDERQLERYRQSRHEN